MITRALSLLALLTCLCGPCAFADETDTPLPADGRIKLLPYSDTDVYTITTRYGYQTSIVFGRGEEVQTISVGDRSLWQLIPAGKRLFIRPMSEGVVTNMTVLTNKRAYQFDLKSLAEGKTTGNIYVARFVYPEDEPPHPAHTAMQAGAMNTVGHPEHPNFNYTYAGPDELAPRQAYDDGQVTYIRYDTPVQAARVFVVQPNGQETPVATHIQGDTIVVDTVAAELAVESQAGAVHVYNEMLNPK